MFKLLFTLLGIYLFLGCGVKGDPLPPVRMDKKMTETTDKKDDSKKKKTKKVYQ